MFKKLEEKFRLHCNARNLELNPNQILVIKKLENYYKDNFRSSIISFFSKEVLIMHQYFLQRQVMG